MTKLSELKLELYAALSALGIMLLFGTIVYKFLEDWSWVQSFYFSVVTMTTVGYGDFVPTTEVSRLFTSFYILTGAAVAFTSLGIVGMRYLELREKKIVHHREKRLEKKINHDQNKY